LLDFLGVDWAWWPAWTSNPVERGDPTFGVFDSHPFPPKFKLNKFTS